MALDNAKLLLRLLWQPAGVMSGILDQGSLLFATVAVLVATLLLQFSVRPLIPRAPAVVQQAPGPGAEQDQPAIPAAHTQPWWWFSFYTPLLVLAIVYVPGTLLVTNLIARLGGLGAVFERDYSSLLTCASMAWAAVNLPVALLARVVPLPVLGGVAALAYLYFGVLMFFAVRTVFGTENSLAAVSVGLSVIPLAAAVVVWGPLRFVMGWLASPFFLFYAFYYLGGEFRNMGAGLRRGQNFRRMLEAAAVNPHDGDAQYQLGLIHQQRRQYTEAAERFRAAVAIDHTETDAHFQLGRMAREQGRFDEALAHFQAVLRQDEKHNLSEIHRETGATYLARGQYEDARRELSIYLDRRPYDPEGLYHYGQTLERSGAITEAREMYARAVEAARTAPPYRRRYTARWSRLAQKQGQMLLQRS
jgi:tetratricopeptide (TPR) repeat protein